MAGMFCMAGPDELTQYEFNIVAESLPEKLNAIDESCPTFYKFSKSVLDISFRSRCLEEGRNLLILYQIFHYLLNQQVFPLINFMGSNIYGI